MGENGLKLSSKFEISPELKIHPAVVMCELVIGSVVGLLLYIPCLLYTSPSPRDATLSRMPSSA